MGAGGEVLALWFLLRFSILTKKKKVIYIQQNKNNTDIKILEYYYN